MPADPLGDTNFPCGGLDDLRDAGVRPLLEKRQPTDRNEVAGCTD
jgi:hypothetical protein